MNKEKVLKVSYALFLFIFALIVAVAFGDMLDQVKDLYNELGVDDLPYITSFLINTRPLIFVIAIAMFAVPANYLIISSFIKIPNKRFWDIVASVVSFLMVTICVFLIAIAIYLPLYSISSGA